MDVRLLPLQIYTKDSFTNYTHVSLVAPKGRYFIGRSDTEYFWNTYCEVMRDDIESVSGFAEKPQQYLPVLADVDLSISHESTKDMPDKLYNSEQVEVVVKVYQKCLKHILGSVVNKKLTCLLLEKDPYVSKDRYKNGFHLHFPYLFLDKIHQNVHLIPRVKEEMKQLDIFSDLELEGDKVIDSSCCNTTWLMYGSRKTPEQKAYLVTKAYDHNCEEQSLEEALNGYEILNVDEELITLNNESDIRFNLPRILSIIPFGRETTSVKAGLEFVTKEKLPSASTTKHEDETPEIIQDNLKEAKVLLDIISPKRAEERNDWIEIGWILYSIGNGCREALDLWIAFSEKVPEKFDEAVCIYDWDSMKRGNYTLGTLRYYAGMDNPKAYEKYKSKNSERVLTDALSHAHYDVATVVHYFYSAEFVFAGEKTWFQFKNHIWERLDDCIELKSKLSTEVVDKFKKLKKDIRFILAEDDEMDSSQIKSYQHKIELIDALIMKLKNNTYKNSIIKECTELFHKQKFMNKLDTNAYLIGMQNGIYDFRKGCLRPGCPEDCISLSMPIEYKEMCHSDPDVVSVMEYLEKVFPDKSVRKYFLDVTSEVFVGGNKRKLVMVWTGEGDNAKSITQSLLEGILGTYAIKFPTSLITGKRTQSSSASPELARAGNGVRWAVLQEPGHNDVMNIGILKELSGNDTFLARGLYEKPREITPMFKLALICNNLPKLPCDDAATWNRLRVLPFESTFVDPELAPKTYEEQLKQKKFPKDPRFGEKIPSMVQALLWILIDHYNSIKDQYERDEPAKVKIATKKYRMNNDVYLQYFNDSLEEDEEAIISLTDMFSNFKEWFRYGYPQSKIPNKDELSDYLLKRYPEREHDDKGFLWKGWKVKSNDKDEGDSSMKILKGE